MSRLRSDLVTLIAVLVALAPRPAFAQLDDTCTVSVNGQTVDVNPDGSFTISNVPAGTNLVQVTAICQRDGVTLYGESEFFPVVNGQTYTVANIPLSPVPPPTMVSISVSPSMTFLDALPSSVQLTVMGSFSDEMIRNVTSFREGSSYSTSNANVVTVDRTGLVAAVDRGAAFVTITNRGATASVSVIVSFAEPTSVEGFVVLEDGSFPTQPATVEIPSQGLTVESDANTGRFIFEQVATDLEPIIVSAMLTVGQVVVMGTSDALTPVPGGLTDAGLITLKTPGVDVVWTGAAADDDWSTESNWIAGNVPRHIDTAVFGALDSGNTSVVDSPLTIGGLRYGGDAIHTMDLGTSSVLHVDGPLQIGFGGSSDGCATTWTNGGTVTFGDPLAGYQIDIGTQTSGSVTGSLTLADTELQAYVTVLYLGRKSSSTGGGTASGTLTVDPGSIASIASQVGQGAEVVIGYNQDTNASSGGFGAAVGELDARDGTMMLAVDTLSVGRSLAGSSTGTLRWNQASPILATTIYFGRGQEATGILDVPDGGSLVLGTTSSPVANLRLGYNDSSTNTGGSTQGHLDFTTTDAQIEMYIGGELSIGRKVTGTGGGTSSGSVILSDNSTLVVGTPSSPAIMHVGRNQDNSASSGGFGNAIGVFDAQASGAVVDLHLSELNVGRSNSGAATGTFRWNRPDPLIIPTVYFGRGQGATGVLVVPDGGTFILGDSNEPIGTLRLGYNDSSTNTTGSTQGHLDFTTTDAQVEMYIGDELSIGHKVTGTGGGTSSGSVILSDNSTLVVGTPSSPAIMHVGRNQDNSASSGGFGNAIGVFDAQASGAVVDLHLSELNVGRSNSGAATGTFRWNRPDPLIIPTVYFGRGQGATGVLVVPDGGTFILGDSNEPIGTLRLGYNDSSTNTGGSTQGHLDFTTTDAQIEMYIGGELSIGRKVTGTGGGTSSGSVILSDNSTLIVGTPSSPAIMHVGYNQDNSASSGGFGNATGVFDTQATGAAVTLHLSELNVGRSVGGAASGQMTLGAGTTVNTDLIRIGVGGTSTGAFGLADGTLSAGLITLSNGTFDFTGGDLQIGTFAGSLVQQGGTLSSRSGPGTMIVTGDYDQTSAGTVVIALGGTEPNTDHDVLQVGGTATLNGVLSINLINGFLPRVGQSFDVLTYGAHVGEFSMVVLPDLGDLTLCANYSGTVLTLTVEMGPCP